MHYETEDPARGCMTTWLESMPHRVNMLSTHSTYVAFGVYPDEEGRYWCVQTFGNAAPNAAAHCAEVWANHRPGAPQMPRDRRARSLTDSSPRTQTKHDVSPHAHSDPIPRTRRSPDMPRRQPERDDSSVMQEPPSPPSWMSQPSFSTSKSSSPPNLPPPRTSPDRLNSDQFPSPPTDMSRQQQPHIPPPRTPSDQFGSDQFPTSPNGVPRQQQPNSPRSTCTESEQRNSVTEMNNASTQCSKCYKVCVPK